MMKPEATVTPDRGAAMIMVLGMMSIMSVVVAAALSYAVTVAPQVSRDKNWQAALAAAQAGVDDYLAKLNRTDAYALTVDCSNVALKGPKAETNSCGWNSGTAAGWVNVQAGNPSAGKFHYDVNTANFWKDGSVWVESTAKCAGVSRTIQVRVAAAVRPTSCTTPTSRTRIRRTWSHIHPGDPSSLATGGAKYDVCGKSGPTLATYWWQGGTRVNSSYCQEIQFAGNDVLDGDVHFNDSPADEQLRWDPAAFPEGVRGCGPQLHRGSRQAGCQRGGDQLGQGQVLAEHVQRQPLRGHRRRSSGAHTVPTRQLRQICHLPRLQLLRGHSDPVQQQWHHDGLEHHQCRQEPEGSGLTRKPQLRQRSAVHPGVRTEVPCDRSDGAGHGRHGDLRAGSHRRLGDMRTRTGRQRARPPGAPPTTRSRPVPAAPSRA